MSRPLALEPTAVNRETLVGDVAPVIGYEVSDRGSDISGRADETER